jgi:hypothetical protein
LTNGQRGDLQLDASANAKMAEQFAPGYEDDTNNAAATVEKLLATNTYAPSVFQNLGANATLNVKASAGNILAFECHNLNAADRFFQLHNTATTPGGGAVPTLTFRVPALGQITRDKTFFPGTGAYGSSGWAFAFSTTEATYTAATATDQMTQIFYK